MPPGGFVALNERTHESQVLPGVCVRCSNCGTHTLTHRGLYSTASHTHTHASALPEILSLSPLQPRNQRQAPARAAGAPESTAWSPATATRRQSSLQPASNTGWQQLGSIPFQKILHLESATQTTCFMLLPFIHSSSPKAQSIPTFHCGSFREARHAIPAAGARARERTSHGGIA